MHFHPNPTRCISAILLLAVNVFVLGACSTSTGSMAPTVSRNATSAAGCTQYSSGIYCKVDDPACTGTCENEVAGINDSEDIVGNWSHCTTGSGGSCSSTEWSCNNTTGTGSCAPCPLVGGAAQWNSYTSTYDSSSNSYSTFFSEQYPDAPNGQYMYAISNESATIAGGAKLLGSPTTPPTIEVGCINAFGGGGGDENGVWANVDNNGLWSQHGKLGEEQGCGNHTAAGALLGFDKTNSQTMTAVGFYTNSTGSNNCHFRVWKTKAGGGSATIPVSFPSNFTPTDIIATGITGTNGSMGGEIVGTATGLNTSDVSVQVGWLMANAYGSSSPVTTYQCPSSNATAFTSMAKIAASDTLEIVGWCTQGSTTHGLVAVYAGSAFTTETIDEPNAHGLTVINGVNTKGDICGWYTDQNGNYHGFVGFGVIAALRHRHHRLRA